MALIHNISIRWVALWVIATLVWTVPPSTTPKAFAMTAEEKREVALKKKHEKLLQKLKQKKALLDMKQDAKLKELQIKKLEKEIEALESGAREEEEKAKMQAIAERKSKECAKHPVHLAYLDEWYIFDVKSRQFFKYDNEAGKKIDPPETPEEPTTSLYLVQMMSRCIYCPEFHEECNKVIANLMQLDKLRVERDEKAYQELMKTIFETIPKALVGLAQLAKKAYDLYQAWKESKKEMEPEPEIESPPEEPPIVGPIPSTPAPMAFVPGRNTEKPDLNRPRPKKEKTRDFLGFTKDKDKDKKDKLPPAEMAKFVQDQKGGGSSFSPGTAPGLSGGGVPPQQAVVPDRPVKYGAGSGGYTGGQQGDDTDAALLALLKDDKSRPQDRLGQGKREPEERNTRDPMAVGHEKTGLGLLILRIGRITRDKMARTTEFEFDEEER